MTDKKKVDCNEEVQQKNGLIIWIKEHRNQLLLAGFSVTALILTIIGFKNKDALIEFWSSLKKEIEKGAKYSDKWFNKANLEELEAAREIVQTDYRNPKLDMNYREECLKLLERFDKAISKIKWDGKEIGYPVHRDGGWYLPSDD